MLARARASWQSHRRRRRVTGHSPGGCCVRSGRRRALVRPRSPRATAGASPYAETPAESIQAPRRGRSSAAHPSRSASIFFASPSANGLRHVFPVHTKSTIRAASFSTSSAGSNPGSLISYPLSVAVTKVGFSPTRTSPVDTANASESSSKSSTASAVGRNVSTTSSGISSAGVSVSNNGCSGHRNRAGAAASVLRTAADQCVGQSALPGTATTSGAGQPRESSRRAGTESRNPSPPGSSGPHVSTAGGVFSSSEPRGRGRSGGVDEDDVAAVARKDHARTCDDSLADRADQARMNRRSGSSPGPSAWQTRSSRAHQGRT